MIPSLRLIDRNNVHTFVSLCIVLHWSIQPMVKNVIQGQWKSSLNKRVIMLEHVRATKSTTFRNQWNAIKGYLSAKRPQLSNKWILHLKLQNQTRMERHSERWLMDLMLNYIFIWNVICTLRTMQTLWPLVKTIVSVLILIVTQTKNKTRYSHL